MAGDDDNDKYQTVDSECLGSTEEEEEEGEEVGTDVRITDDSGIVLPQGVAAPRPEDTYSYKDDIYCGDFLLEMEKIPLQSADVIICDPPSRLGKDFGKDSDRLGEEEYLDWCGRWIPECHRILKRAGTCYIFGMSTTLALVHARICANEDVDGKVDWMVWQYTNKTNPKAKTWQKSHESILFWR